MKYETFKSIILFALVLLSSVFSFLLWTYQPKYDVLDDMSYVSEVDVGGSEKKKSDLIAPTQIIFHHDEAISGFTKPIERQRFFKEFTSWTLYDYAERDFEELPETNKIVELKFPDEFPVDLITNLFTFDEEIVTPNWSFNEMFLIIDDEEELAELIVNSSDERKQITAIIDKNEIYYYLLSHMEEETEITTPFITFEDGAEPIYLPNVEIEHMKKTFIANTIEPEEFVNALFASPSVVTSNLSEAYFTDGQRGMEVVQDGRRLEYINPIQAQDTHLDALELIERSMNHINEHKGWTNDFLLEKLDSTKNAILFRMHYEGYPTFDRYRLTTIEEKWREEELYQYTRPLVSVGNLLNSSKKSLPSGSEVISIIKEADILDLEDINDIQIGYTMDYVEDAYSLTLKPEWYISYKEDWIPFKLVESERDKKGGD